MRFNKLVASVLCLLTVSTALAGPLPSLSVQWWPNNQGCHVVHTAFAKDLTFQFSGEWLCDVKFVPSSATGVVLAEYPDGNFDIFQYEFTATVNNNYHGAGSRGFWSGQIDINNNTNPTYNQVKGAGSTLTMWVFISGTAYPIGGVSRVIGGESSTFTWSGW